MKYLNKILNINLKILAIWLNVNKIPLFFKKTKMVFKFKKKKFQGDKKIKQMAKGFITKSVKSLGIKIDKNLN